MRNTLFLPVIGAFAALLLQGCGQIGTKRPIHTLSELGKGEVIYVGKVVMDPPLGNEQRLDDGFEGVRNKAMLVLGDRFENVSDTGLTDYDLLAGVELGKTFIIKDKRPAALYYSGGSITMERGMAVDAYGRRGLRSDNMIFDSPVKAEFPPNAKAVYLGTFHYTRHGEHVTGFKIEDDYQQARKKFRAQLGSGVKLVRAKLTRK